MVPVGTRLMLLFCFCSDVALYCYYAAVICFSFYLLFLILFYLCAIAIRSYDRKFQINTYLLTKTSLVRSSSEPLLQRQNATTVVHCTAAAALALAPTSQKLYSAFIVESRQLSHRRRSTQDASLDDCCAG